MKIKIIGDDKIYDTVNYPMVISMNSEEKRALLASGGEKDVVIKNKGSKAAALDRYSFSVYESWRATPAFMRGFLKRFLSELNPK